jgi:accessory gene regulator protein AgrB
MIKLYKVVLVSIILWIILAMIDETLTINIVIERMLQKVKRIPGALKSGARKYVSAWNE